MQNAVTALFELHLSKSTPLSDDERSNRSLTLAVNAAYAKIQAIALEYDKDNPINNDRNDRVFVLNLPQKAGC